MRSPRAASSGCAQWRPTTLPIRLASTLISLGIGAGVRSHREEYGYLEGIAIVVVVCFVVFLQAGIDYDPAEAQVQFRYAGEAELCR